MKQSLLKVILIALVLAIFSCEKNQDGNEGADYLVGTWELTEVADNEGNTFTPDTYDRPHPARRLTFRSDMLVTASEGVLCGSDAESTVAQSTAYQINSPLSIDCPPNANCIPNILVLSACKESLNVIFHNELMTIQYAGFSATYRRAD